MSDSELGSGSLIIPDTNRIGKFRCGICWSADIRVSAATEEDGIRVHIMCPACGNAVTLKTAPIPERV